MANGHVLWRHATPRREDGGLARRLGRQARRPRDGRHTSGCCAAATAASLSRFAVGSPIESSPVVRDGDRLLRHLERPRLRARPATRQHVRWTFTLGLQDHLARRDRRAATLYIGDYCGRLLALDRATGRAALGRQRQRAHLRHAGGRRRPRLRPGSTGGSLTAFSTERPAALAPHGRLLRLLVARRLGRPRLLRLVRRRLLRASRPRPAATLWSVSAGGPISGAAVVVDGVAYAGSFAHRIVGVDARTGRVAARLPARASTSRSRATAAGCSCTATRGSTPSRRGEAAAADRRRRRRARRRRPRRRLRPDDPARAARHPRLVDGRVRPDRRRRRRSRRSPGSSGRCTATTRSGCASRPASRSRPPFRRVWTFRARSLVEFPPAIAYGRLFFANNAGVPVRDQREDRQARVAVRLGPLPGDVAGGRRATPSTRPS